MTKMRFLNMSLHSGTGLISTDFYALTVDAMMAAVKRHLSVVNSGSQLVLTLKDFRVASERLVPSVSKKDTSVQS